MIAVTTALMVTSLVLAVAMLWQGRSRAAWLRWHVYAVAASYAILCALILFGVGLRNLSPAWLVASLAAFALKAFALFALLLDHEGRRLRLKSEAADECCRSASGLGPALDRQRTAAARRVADLPARAKEKAVRT